MNAPEKFIANYATAFGSSEASAKLNPEKQTKIKTYQG